MHDSGDTETRSSPPPIAKAEGAFLALAAGDALGWPQEMPRYVRGAPTSGQAHVEFKKWTRRGGGRFRPYEETIGSGHYSDDTQLTLAIARSRVNHASSWWKAFTRIELPLWLLYERGGGGATKRAASAWAETSPPWRSRKRDGVRQYFDAGGNGVAMRVLPHALFHAGQDKPTSLMHDVVLDGSATHGHPRALVGATAYAYAAWSLARKTDTLRFGELLETLLDGAREWSRFPESARTEKSWLEVADEATNARFREIWVQTTREMRDLLEKARKGLQAGALADDREVLDDLGCFGRAKGAGTSSAAGAAYLAARHAAQPVQGVLTAAFEHGADTDTLAAMTGGLLGCVSGVEWLPQPWLQVQDAKYLRNMAARVARGPDGAAEVPIEPVPRPQSILSSLEPNEGGEVELGGATRVAVSALQDPKPAGRTIAVHAWRLRTADGQTMYVTKVRRRTEGPRQKVAAEPRQLCYSASGPGPDKVTEYARHTANELYLALCRQLELLLNSAGEMKPKEVGDALGLVPTQTANWLRQAEREGLVRRTSKKPVKFGLQAAPLI